MTKEQSENLKKGDVIRNHCREILVILENDKAKKYYPLKVFDLTNFHNPITYHTRGYLQSSGDICLKEFFDNINWQKWGIKK